MLQETIKNFQANINPGSSSSRSATKRRERALRADVVNGAGTPPHTAQARSPRAAFQGRLGYGGLNQQQNEVQSRTVLLAQAEPRPGCPAAPGAGSHGPPAPCSSPQPSTVPTSSPCSCAVPRRGRRGGCRWQRGRR